MDDPLVFEMTPATLARAMAGRLARERRRLAEKLDLLTKDIEEGSMEFWIAERTAALAAEVRAGVEPSLALVPTSRVLTAMENDPREIAEGDPGDGLPPVQFRDDVEEGEQLVRNRNTAIFARGGGMRD